MDVDRLRKYVMHRRRQRELEAELAEVKDEANALEQYLLEDFAEAGIDRMTIEGQTIYLHRQLWAQVPAGVEKAEVIEAMKDAGVDHFVREDFNTQTVSAWLRELEREGEEVPTELEGLLESSERYSLRVRRS